MKQWEYEVIGNETPLEKHIMDRFGREGWENYGIVFAAGRFYYYFKRYLQ